MMLLVMPHDVSVCLNGMLFVCCCEVCFTFPFLGINFNSSAVSFGRITQSGRSEEKAEKMLLRQADALLMFRNGTWNKKTIIVNPD